MVSRNTAATGRRRYGLGNSYAPTRGTVNPGGYIKRELSKVGRLSQPIQGADRFGGVSQRRSGLAAAALRNNAIKPQIKPPKPKAKPVYNGPKAGFHMPKGGGGAGNKKFKAGFSMPGKINNKKAGGAGAPAVAAPAHVAAAASLAAPNIPTVRIGANGRLDLPFDMAYSLGLVEAQQQADAELLSLQQEEQQFNNEMAVARRDLDLDYGNVRRDTLNNNSARGMAYSSGYANDVSQNANQYNNFLNDFATQETSARTGFMNARTGIENGMNDFIRQSILQQAEELAAEQAGDLGYGVTEGPEPSYPKPPKPKKPKPKAGGGGGGNNNKPKPKPPPKGGFHMPGRGR